MFIDLDSIPVDKHAKQKKNKAFKCPATLTEQAWSIQDLLHEKNPLFSQRTKWVILSRQEST